MSRFTDEEICALSQFRTQVKDVTRDEFGQRDENLIRWLRARNLNLDKAEEMLRESLKWREDNDIDKLQEDPALSEKFPVHFDGLDKVGRPVLTCPFGAWDVKGFVEFEVEGLERFVKYCNKILEIMLETIKRLTLDKKENDGEFFVQFVLLVDLSGYSLGQLMNLKAVQAMITLVSVFEAHYPEILAAVFCINAPAVFYMFFALLKPFLSGGTLGKVKIFNSDKTVWLPVILDVVDNSQIRHRFGGRN